MSEEKELVRIGKPSTQTVILLALLGVGGVGGLSGNKKLDEIGASVTRLDGKLEHVEASLVELRTKVQETERLALDARTRALEQIGAERRLDTLEREFEQQKKGK